jgi:hypothetical protein
MTSAPPEIKKWLESFASAISEDDYETGKKLFDSRVVSFGMDCERAEGIDQLVEKQWKVFWDRIEVFEFDYNTAMGTLDETTGTAAATWRSVKPLENGQSVEKRGRATFVFLKTGDNLIATHSHLSATPES